MASKHPDTAWIFDVLALKSDSPIAPGFIPLSPSFPSYGEKHYWRIPIRLHVVLTILLLRTATTPSKGRCEEVKLAINIYAKLQITQIARVVEHNDSNPPGGSGDGGDGGRHSGEDDQGRRNGHVSKEGSRRAGQGHGADPKRKDGGFEDSGNDSKRKRGTDPDVDDDDASGFISDSGEADPENWEFGPSFSTNRNVFEARGYILV